MLLALATFALSVTVAAQTVCKNPVMWADMPDPDVIRVGDTYYMVSTTMCMMPGAPIYESRDLVHWSLCSYLFDKLTDSPLYDLNGGTSYGRGQWATSLKYHKGIFYALFCTNDPRGGGDSYVFTTTDPHKGWTLYSRLPHFHDPSLFFDDDGRVYVFHGSGNITELEADLKSVKKGGVDCQLIGRDMEENSLLEGSRVIKKDGKYYAMMISWPRDKPRRQLCYRADNITGPYGKAVLIEDNFAGFPYIGQGTIVDTPQGDWYAVIFQDRDAIGRVPLLIPCRWVEGWPVLGDDKGRTPAVFTVNTQSGSVGNEADWQCGIVASDDFTSKDLKGQWQWNHNPIEKGWSLTERKGWLRLRTQRVVDNLFMAPNTITQRMEGPQCSGVVCLDISKMRNGDRAGFAAFNGHSGVLVVERDNDKFSLSEQTMVLNLSDRDKSDRDHAVEFVDVDEKARIALTGKRVYLRIDADFRLGKDIATFHYSTDGKRWHAIGQPFKMRFDYTRVFMGTRFAIFNYATKQVGGHVDVDFFKYQKTENDE